MSIRCQCAQCGVIYNLADTTAGKKIKCAKCKAIFKVPALEEEILLPEPEPEPVPEPTPFSLVNAGSSSAISSGGYSSGSYHVPPKPNPLLPLIVGIVALFVVVIAGGAFFALSGGGVEKPAANKPTKKTPTTGTLVLDWPENERPGAKLTIDKGSKLVPPSGPMTLNLKPGSHEVTIQRRGYEPVTIAVDITAGEESKHRPEFKETPKVATNPTTPGTAARVTPLPTPTPRYETNPPPVRPNPVNPNPTNPT